MHYSAHKVDHSLRNYPWRSRLDENQERRAAQLAQHLTIPELLARVMIGRGVTPDKAEHYLKPRLSEHLQDPSTLKDAEKAAQLINKALDQKQSIAVFADYDVDGACSAALLTNYARAFGISLNVHIPDRLIEGYGPNEAAIKNLHDAGAQVLICVDCGASSKAPLAYAKSLGLTIIVIDHHMMTDNGADVDALVNPNRIDDLSNLGHLAAAGVVFMVLIAANRARKQKGEPTDTLPDLLTYLDLVSFATICDVVPLRGLNRAFVTQGLTVMKQAGRIGFRALINVSQLDRPLESYHLGFMLGPRINAGGRIGDSSLGFQLLTTTNEAEALNIAETLNKLNRERQQIEQMALDQAYIQAETKLLANPNTAVLMLDDATWHVGVIGLIAARVRERFDIPTFAISWQDDGTGKGSGRSVEGLDLGSLVIKAQEMALITKGGGHAMAAGLSLEKSQFEAFDNFLQRQASHDFEKVKTARVQHFDASVSASGLTLEVVNELMRSAPFGRDNTEPRLVLFHHQIHFTKPVGTNHLKLTLGDQHGGTVDAIAFRVMDDAFGAKLMQMRGQNIHVLGTPTINHWQGRDRVSFKIIDAAIPEA